MNPRRMRPGAGAAFLGLILLGGGGPWATAGRVFAETSAGPTDSQQEVAVLTTPYGTIVWRFFETDAPGHVAYVKDLIRKGFYEKTTFHRVIPHFVIQGGDPNSKDEDRGNDGEGEGDRRLKAEFSTRLHYRPGTVGMARDTDPDSGSCQFFIALADLPRLDARYTIFGEVIEGLEVARRIADRPRDLADNPLERIAISARLESRRVTGDPRSLSAGAGSGEVLSGPTKPRPFDPGNVLWTAPRLKTGGATARDDAADAPPAPAAGAPSPSPQPARPAVSPRVVRLEVAVAPDGSVIDVRFPAPIDAGVAAKWRETALAWRFEPPAFEGKPQKARFEIDSDGRYIGPSSGGGAPVVIGSDMTPPRPVVRIPLPAGQAAPARPARLRLTIDDTGNVTEAWLQVSCGDAGLDTAALEEARRLAFEPARRGRGPGPGEPVMVYLDVEARFVPRT